AATNRNLEEAVAKGEYREDLYYRINVVAIFLPPLRERREDVPLLAEYFLKQANEESGKQLKFSAEAMQVLMNCNWPGNVRELNNCVERIAAMTQGNLIRRKDLLCDREMCFSSIMWQQHSKHHVMPIVSARQPLSVPVREAADEEPHDSGDDAHYAMDAGNPQRQQIIEALEKCGWVQAKAARYLGITPRQMGYAILKHGIDVKRY
ncbi:MAG TPA: helix-turn-helix domain-containing protein, partial [Gallionellaceae bacterium]